MMIFQWKIIRAERPQRKRRARAAGARALGPGLWRNRTLGGPDASA